MPEAVREEQLVKLAKAVLARDAEWSLSGMPNDCGCMRLSREAEHEYEGGRCPHQRLRGALTTIKEPANGQ